MHCVFVLHMENDSLHFPIVALDKDPESAVAS